MARRHVVILPENSDRPKRKLLSKQTRTRLAIAQHSTGVDWNFGLQCSFCASKSRASRQIFVRHRFSPSSGGSLRIHRITSSADETEKANHVELWFSMLNFRLTQRRQLKIALIRFPRQVQLIQFAVQSEDSRRRQKLFSALTRDSAHRNR